MEDILFIGNGLNRCENLGVSWTALLQQLTNTFKITYTEDTINTLEFERLVFQVLKKQETPLHSLDTIKKKVAENFINILLPEKEILHKKFLSLPIKTILTTNYDYVLECILDNKRNIEDVLVSKEDKSENKYSFKRYYQVKDKTIYHIHGEARKSNTILLGYEHYVGTAQHLREAIKKPKDTYIKNVLEGKENQETWAEVFFTKNIHIIGFTFDYSELELWWLLTYRAHLYYTNKEIFAPLMKNRIIFYDIQEKNTMHQKRQQIFEDFHVEYKKITVINKDYRSAYLSIYHSIEKELLEQKETIKVL